MTDRPHRARIILGATTLADAAGALALATALAVEGSELHGLLVEDEEVLALCTAQGACIVAPAGRAGGTLDAGRLRRAFIGEAARFERLLAEAAGRAAVRASFSLGRGRLAASLAAAAGPGDLMIVAAGPFRAPVREVVLLSAGLSDPALPVLARATAERLRRPLRTIGGIPPSGGAADAAAAAGMLDTLGTLGPGAILFAELSRTGLSLEDVLRRTRCTCVLRA
ncbi:hypothetical protein [Albidovulum sp.]|uniref:hypothetical protein n=1 Tax=Albidovulum sp. TaxID=1872424 RepID=UPI0039B934CC